MTRPNTPAVQRRTRPSRHAIAGLAAAAALVAGCASAPEPTAELVAARQAVTQAEQAQAVEHAAEVMSESRTKLALAEAAVKEGQMEKAGRLADEARVDAELAAAQAAAAKAQAANDELRRSTQTLIDEMQRSDTGGTP
jgi:PBP1b-binding outer membrane lipoprotein LpoB